ncbi:MAG: hypothetical protein WEC15_04125, partial [Flavobacteriales bacterium]
MIRSIAIVASILPFFVAAQNVGINNPTPAPSALLDLTSTERGLLVPRMSTVQRDAIPLPATSLLVFNTTNARFEFFDGTTWVPLVVGGGTLDQAYDFGGAGLGRTITADAGTVLIDGTDGLVSTGTFGSGAISPSGAGTRLVWNPRKGAFRAGRAFATQWDDVNVGNYSAAFGNSTASGQYSFASGGSTASGESSVALGASATASGYASIGLGYFANASGAWSYALGYVNTASGGESAAIGSYSTASGYRSITMGSNATASGSNSKSMAYRGEAFSFGETVLGIGPSTYTPSTDGATQFRPANSADRLLVVGNAIDVNNNGNVDASERSDAFVILKNGNTGIGSSTPQERLHVVGSIRMVDGNEAAGRLLVSAANGTGTWTAPGAASAGTLDQSYDFGGAGAGRTIAADAGAVRIDGTDGLVSTGTVGSGVIPLEGDGTRMMWYPGKAAFRAGTVSGTQWNDTNIGLNSVAFNSARASGEGSHAGNFAVAGGLRTAAFNSGWANGTSSSAFGEAFSLGMFAMAWGSSVFPNGALAPYSTAFGLSNRAAGSGSTAFGFLNSATGNYSTVWGGPSNRADGIQSTVWGRDNIAGSYGTAWGGNNGSLGQYGTTWGQSNVGRSYAETALGIGATLYTPSVNGSSQFRPANATDRLLVVGNAIDANNNDSVDVSERSDAFVILKNGNTGVGSSTPQERLHVVGNIRMVDGNEAAGRLLLSDANGTGTWTAPGAASAGTLDQSYDFGAAGAGRVITADAGAVAIIGTDGLVSTGIVGSGALAPSNSGTRMLWNPRKGAFRAGSVIGAAWDDPNIGLYSTAFGDTPRASGSSSMAMGALTVASGDRSTAMGSFTLASGDRSTAMGSNTSASGVSSLAMGAGNSASGNNSTAMGLGNTAPSFGETVLGIGATTYTPSLFGTTQWRASNASDRLLVVGNAIDANSNNMIDPAEFSNALVILKNGNTGIGTSTPQDRLHVVGSIRMEDGNEAAGSVLVSDANGTASWQVPAVAPPAWGLTGNASAATNFLGSTNAQPLSIRTNNVERVRILSNGNMGIGTDTPQRRVHIFSGSSGGTSSGNVQLVVENSVNNYQQFLAPSTSQSGFLFGTENGGVRGALLFNDGNTL